MSGKDLKTLGVVLKRTNYSEADRILNIITPEGKIAAIAKSARKEKSKLAGGIEMFSLAEFVVHQGRSELGVVTSAKMVRHYGGILKDFERMELAGMVLRRIAAAAEQVDNPEYFEITRQCLGALDAGTSVELVEGWFWLNLLRVTGEEVNLYRDVTGARLEAELRYDWDAMEGAFTPREQGKYGVDEIKMLRLMITGELGLVRRVKLTGVLQRRILEFARIVAKM